MGGGGENSFIEPLGLLLGLTAVAALLLSYLKQSTIVAFILVGALVNFFGNDVDSTVLGHFSEVGILVLLFMAGLEVELHAFIKSWVSVVKVGLGQILFTSIISYPLSLLVLPAIGSVTDGKAQIYFCLCMTFSSTILVLGYLKKSKSMGTVYGQLCLGTLVLQDVTSVIALAILSGLSDSSSIGSCLSLNKANNIDCTSATDWNGCDSLAPHCVFFNASHANTSSSSSSRLLLASSSSSSSSTTTTQVLAGCYDICSSLVLTSEAGQSVCTSTLGGDVCSYQPPEGGGIALSIFLLFVKLLAVCLILAILDRYVLNKLFNQFARSLELLYLGSLGYAFGLAAIAVRAGFSGEITAFLAGVSVAQLPYKLHIESKMEPIKSLGVAIFFLALGLQLDLNQQTLNALPISICLALFKLILTVPLFMLLGFTASMKSRDCWMMGLLMNQISEFSLILCTLSVRAGVLSPIVLTTLTLAAIISIVISGIGHIFVEPLYEIVKKGRYSCSCCFKCIDDHHRGKSCVDTCCCCCNTCSGTSKGKGQEERRERQRQRQSVLEMGGRSNSSDGGVLETRGRVDSLIVAPPGGLDDDHEDDWVFEDQLKDRSMEQLHLDLRKVEKELEHKRNQMSITVEEKSLNHGPTDLYGKATSKKMATSHAMDIVHGLIEGYVIVEHQLLFCTLRGGRMLFWHDQHDVGHIAPTSVWDVSGMRMISVRHQNNQSNDKFSKLSGLSKFAGGKEGTKRTRRRSSFKPLDDSRISTMSVATTLSISDVVVVNTDEDDWLSDGDDDDDDEEFHPWEWTIVMAHLHRTDQQEETEQDFMKLAIHGLEDHSDHDCNDWQDALSVMSATLNPIALRRAHIKEEISKRKKAEKRKSTLNSKTFNNRSSSVQDRMVFHDHRDQIICLGYNEMFPAVLSLADATNKEVVVVEYDPLKIKAVQKQYNQEQRNQDMNEKKSTQRLQKDGKNTGNMMEYTMKKIMKEDGGGGGGGEGQGAGAGEGETSATNESENKSNGGNSNSSKTAEPQRILRGVDCVYADVHDPESWEELEFDEAFMIVCCMKEARHAEKAIVKWLKQHRSATIFIACTTNNVECLQLYNAGADFVMQTDALAMRSTREIFLEMVANVGNCSQLVQAGASHLRRLKKMKQENPDKFRYECG
jgi:Kef-type K+ transport system membrane component KefB